jgi:hypothetical protein
VGRKTEAEDIIADVWGSWTEAENIYLTVWVAGWKLRIYI